MLSKHAKNKTEYNLMIQSLIYEINKTIMDGYDTFMFGACYGFGLICAEQVLIRSKRKITRCIERSDNMK